MKRMTYTKAVDLLRLPDRRLVKMHSNQAGESMCWYIMPDGPVSDELAGKLLNRPDMTVIDMGLLSETPQSWKIGDWRG